MARKFVAILVCSGLLISIPGPQLYASAAPRLVFTRHLPSFAVHPLPTATGLTGVTFAAPLSAPARMLTPLGRPEGSRVESTAEPRASPLELLQDLKTQTAQPTAAAPAAQAAYDGTKPSASRGEDTVATYPGAEEVSPGTPLPLGPSRRGGNSARPEKTIVQFSLDAKSSTHIGNGQWIVQVVFLKAMGILAKAVFLFTVSPWAGGIYCATLVLKVPFLANVVAVVLHDQVLPRVVDIRLWLQNKILPLVPGSSRAIGAISRFVAIVERNPALTAAVQVAGVALTVVGLEMLSHFALATAAFKGHLHIGNLLNAFDAVTQLNPLAPLFNWAVAALPSGFAKPSAVVAAATGAAIVLGSYLFSLSSDQGRAQVKDNWSPNHVNLHGILARTSGVVEVFNGRRMILRDLESRFARIVLSIGGTYWLKADHVSSPVVTVRGPLESLALSKRAQAYLGSPSVIEPDRPVYVSYRQGSHFIGSYLTTAGEFYDKKSPLDEHRAAALRALSGERSLLIGLRGVFVELMAAAATWAALDSLMPELHAGLAVGIVVFIAWSLSHKVNMRALFASENPHASILDRWRSAGRKFLDSARAQKTLTMEVAIVEPGKTVEFYALWDAIEKTSRDQVGTHDLLAEGVAPSLLRQKHILAKGLGVLRSFGSGLRKQLLPSVLVAAAAAGIAALFFPGTFATAAAGLTGWASTHHLPDFLLWTLLSLAAGIVTTTVGGWLDGAYTRFVKPRISQTPSYVRYDSRVKKLPNALMAVAAATTAAAAWWAASPWLAAGAMGVFLASALYNSRRAGRPWLSAAAAVAFFGAAALPGPSGLTVLAAMAAHAVLAALESRRFRLENGTLSAAKPLVMGMAGMAMFATALIVSAPAWFSLGAIGLFSLAVLSHLSQLESDWNSRSFIGAALLSGALAAVLGPLAAPLILLKGAAVLFGILALADIDRTIIGYQKSRKSARSGWLDAVFDTLFSPFAK